MKKSLIAFFAILILAGCSGSNQGENNYSRISSPESHADITMFFWYRCPACYRAEKEISEWIKNTDYTIEYRHSAIWEDDARIFYTLDLLGLTGEYQSKLMEYFRHASNPNIEGIASVIDNKFTPEQILRRLESHHVRNRISATRSYESYVGSNGVPLIIVNNEFALVGNGLSSGNITKTIEHILSEK